MDKKNYLIAGLVVLVALMAWESSQPKRPVLRWIGGFLSKAIWVAPLVLDEPEQPQLMYQAAPSYGAEPVRAEGLDGYAILEHGAGW